MLILDISILCTKEPSPCHYKSVYIIHVNQQKNATTNTLVIASALSTSIINLLQSRNEEAIDAIHR